MPGLEGTTLGRYRLKSRLGWGGMSEVYLAYDQDLDRDVAIKVVSSSHTDYIERFKREARAIGKLDHEHILPAFASGEHGPWHYLVMPYIEHSTLRERLERGPLTLEEAGELLQQIAGALNFAHEHGIVHRDIKPSNILLRDDHYAYLADFGLAKSMQGRSTLTQTGTLLGTPEYMAPELSEGPATTSSDLYALGILLYQMVTGRVPFEADTPMAVFFKQLRDMPTPPSHINPAIPPAVERVILRALDKDPRLRYPTANDLARAYMYALATSNDADEIAPYDMTELQETVEPTYPAYAQESPSHVETPPYIAIQSVHAEQLVLPANPAAPPSAVPSSRNRKGLSRPLLRRNRSAAPPVQPPQDEATILQPPYPPQPRQPLRSTPVYPIRHPSGVRQRRQRSRATTNRLMITALMGMSLLLFFLALVIFALVNHNSGSQPGVDANATQTAQAGTPAATQTNPLAGATATARAQAQATQTQHSQGATATAVTGGTVILSDPLSSNTNASWPNDGTSCAFLNGTYHVLVKSADFLQPCELKGTSFDNVAMRVNLSLISGNDAGIIFRANSDQFYDFEINNSGEFFFRRHDAGGGARYTYLIDNTSSAAIAPGSQKNTLLLVANGSDFKLFINGAFAGEVHDTTYASGQLGFIAGTLSPNTSGDASFSNLTVFKTS